MQGSMISRLVRLMMLFVFVFVGGMLAVASAFAQGQGAAQMVCDGEPCTVGLALDSRGYLYAASPGSGGVFSVPPSSAPVLLGTVPGVPSCLAVSRTRTVFVGTESGAVYTVSLTGEVREVCRVESGAMELAVDRDGGLIVSTGNGRLVRVSAADFTQR